MVRRKRLQGRTDRASRRLMILGWAMVGLGLAGHIVNEFSAGIPVVHYSLLGTMLFGGWLGLRHLR